MSVQYYLELESGLPLPELVKLMEEDNSITVVRNETLIRINTPYTSFDIDVGEEEKRAVSLGIQTDAILIFWVRAYDMGFAKSIQILSTTIMNMAYYYQDMDDPMYYRVDGKVYVNAGFGWEAERLAAFKDISHELVNLKESK
jgi:hypothetical protein